MIAIADVRAIAEGVLFKTEASKLAGFAESLTEIYMDCRATDPSTSLVPKVTLLPKPIRPSLTRTRPQDFPKARKSFERWHAFTIFATRMLEQRVLQAYQNCKAREERLRVFRRLQDKKRPRLLMPSTMTLFEPGDIEIDYAVPPNTSGAFCDLLCGRHSTLGKVALKRLRTDMSGTDRLSVRLGLRALPYFWSLR